MTKTYTPWSLLGSSFWDTDILNSRLDDSGLVGMKLDDSCGVIVTADGLPLELVSTISGVTVKVG